MSQLAQETLVSSPVVQRLSAYGLFDGSKDPELDAVTAEAVRLIGVPAALIGFFDGEVEHIRSWQGWRVASLPGVYSLAAPVMSSGVPRIVNDATADPLLARHPLVSGQPLLCFIASAPILTPDGIAIGALTVIDRVAHQAPQGVAEILRLLAGRVSDTLATPERVARLQAAPEERDERFRAFFERTTDFLASIH